MRRAEEGASPWVQLLLLPGLFYAGAKVSLALAIMLILLAAL